jgi:hypothetical protein
LLLQLGAADADIKVGPPWGLDRPKYEAEIVLQGPPFIGSKYCYYDTTIHRNIMGPVWWCYGDSVYPMGLLQEKGGHWILKYPNLSLYCDYKIRGEDRTGALANWRTVHPDSRYHSAMNADTFCVKVPGDREYADQSFNSLVWW